MHSIPLSRASALRGLAACALALGLGGCSFGPEIATHAVAYNKAVETAENEMFLLNIVRAAKYYPMHFTRITEFTGALEGSGQVGAKPPLGSDAPDIFGLDLQLGGRSKPTFGVRVLDDEKFMKGIQTPIAPAMFRFYLDQGWRMQVLLYALAEKVLIEFTPASNAGTEKAKPITLCEIRNQPGDAKTMAQFEKLVALLSDKTVKFESASGKEYYGPMLRGQDIHDIAAFAELHKAGFKTEQNSSYEFRLLRPTTTSAFRLPKTQLTQDFARSVAQRDGLGAACDAATKARLFREVPEDQFRADIEKSKLAEISATITLRSAQGLIFYLGELARPQLWHDAPPISTTIDHKQQELFVIEKGPAEGTAISVEHGGTVYAIPEGVAGGRSLQMIALARQLFSLNLSAEATPTTQTIRFIN